MPDIHAQNLMTCMVQCVLRTEHPCPDPNDVHGLKIVLPAEHPCPKPSDVHGRKTVLPAEHPCPKLNDVHGLVRFENRASMPRP